MIVKSVAPGQKFTEVHIHSAEPGYQTRVEKFTVLPVIEGDNWAFAVAQWDSKNTEQKKPDLVAIQRRGIANGTVRIHVLPSESACKIWIAHRFAAFDLVDDMVDLLVIDGNGDGFLDLVAIRNSKDEDARTSVEILAGATQYQDFLLRTDTALRETYGVFDYAMADWTGDGRPDRVVVKKEATKSEMAEVHVLLG